MPSLEELNAQLARSEAERLEFDRLDRELSWPAEDGSCPFLPRGIICVALHRPATDCVVMGAQCSIKPNQCPAGLCHADGSRGCARILYIYKLNAAPVTNN